MEFLKELFGGETLTFEQLAEKVKEKKMNVVDIATGEYVGKAKFDDRVRGLTQQVTDLQAQLNQRDTDMAGLKTKLTEAQADASKLPEAQNALAALQGKYDTDRQAWDAKIRKQEYEFMVREKAGALKFSSTAAKNEFIRDAIGKDFKVDGNTLLGYDDFVAKYKTDDPGAFAKEPDGDPQKNDPPQIIIPQGQSNKPEPKAFGFHFNGVRPKPDDAK